MKRIFATLLLALLGLFVGCQTLTESGEVERIAIQAGTIRYINEAGETASERQERAARVADRVSKMRAIVADESVALDIAEEQILAMIPWEEFTDEEQFLIEELVGAINREIQAQIEAENGLLTGEERVYLDTYLGWVEEIARERS